MFNNLLKLLTSAYGRHLLLKFSIILSIFAVFNLCEKTCVRFLTVQADFLYVINEIALLIRKELCTIRPSIIPSRRFHKVISANEKHFEFATWEI